MKMLEQVKAARRVSAPLVVINTPDPAATITAIVEGVNGDSAKLAWDFCQGLKPCNEQGAMAIGNLNAEMAPSNPAGMMLEAARLPAKAILFVHNAQRYLLDDGFVQGVWNLRDRFKQDGRTLILLGPQVDLPAELETDAVVIDEPLPDREAIAVIVRQVHESAELTVSDETVVKAVDATQGLSAFQVEQVVSMSLTRDGLILDDLWERKRQTIEQTPGLAVWRGGESFDDLGGLQHVKDFTLAIMRGQRPPNAIVFIDEIEKAMAGASGDTSGTSQDQLGALLSYMQDNEQIGTIFLGPPGSGKSAIAKSLGNEIGVPTVQLDLGGMKDSLVGGSEKRIRNALRVIKAISGGEAMWVATSNDIGAIKSELQRRFTLGRFFFDLPTQEERAKIWEIYRQRYGLGNDLSRSDINDAGWTGAEIKQCCDIAWRTGVPLAVAAGTVVPVSQSDPKVEKLRKDASGKFASASASGIYRHVEQSGGGRQIDLNS